MDPIAVVLIVLVALEHAWFLVLEMFLWTKPIGLRTFGNTPERAEATAILAANQGLYNGFLAAGLVFAVLYPEASAARAIATFFLVCIIVAGVYGARTVSLRILYVQSLPALIALIMLWLSGPRLL